MSATDTRPIEKPEFAIEFDDSMRIQISLNPTSIGSIVSESVSLFKVLQ